VNKVYTFDDAKSPSRHCTQYFEMLGNRAIYNDGWVAATTPPPPPWAAVAGKHHIELDFKYGGPGLGKGGTAALMVDGKPAGEGKLARTLAFRMYLDETLDCGEDTGTPVSEDYHVPFKFTGKIDKVAVRLGEEKLTPEERREFDEVRGRGAMAE
jgi:arylsulfatase